MTKQYTREDIGRALKVLHDRDGEEAVKTFLDAHAAYGAEDFPTESIDAAMATLSTKGIKPPTPSTRDALNDLAHAKFAKPDKPNPYVEVAEGAETVAQAMNNLGTYANAARKLK